MFHVPQGPHGCAQRRQDWHGQADEPRRERSRDRLVKATQRTYLFMPFWEGHMINIHDGKYDDAYTVCSCLVLFAVGCINLYRLRMLENGIWKFQTA